MDCRYREKDYCTYSNRTCNPNALSCYKNHKPKNYSMATLPKNTSKRISKTENDTGLFPKKYDKTIKLSDKATVIIFGGALKIKKNKLKDYSIIVNDLIDPKKKYSLYVICNTNSGRFYMGDRVLKYYMKKKYHPNLIFKYAGSSECTEPLSDIEMSEVSILKMYGYTVGKSGLLKKQRQALLKHILDNNIMRGHDIISLLQFNIAMRERKDKYAQAIEDWEDDISFVTDYFDK